MLKKLQTWIRDFLGTLSSNTLAPKLRYPNPLAKFLKKHSVYREDLTDDERYKRNLEDIELAKFNLQKEAIDKNLLAQHRLMIATLIAALVALVTSVIGIFLVLRDEPPVVNVPPPQVQVIEK